MQMRDPRLNPIAGDRLKIKRDDLSAPEVRWVEWVRASGRIQWSGYLRETTKTYSCTLATWRKWAKDATIVAFGKEDADA